MERHPFPAIRRRSIGPDRMAAQLASDCLPATCRRRIGSDRYGTTSGCTKYTRIDGRRALPAPGSEAANHPRVRIVRIAFYAPLKAPDHPTPSGDSTHRRLLVRALERAGHEVALASRLRTFDGVGDRARPAPAGAYRAGRGATVDRPLAGLAPRASVLVHVPPLPQGAGLGSAPRVSARLRIPYLVAEASYAPEQAQGAWRHGHRAVAAALARADRVIALNPDDVPGLERLLGGFEDPARDPREFPDDVSGLERLPGGLEGLADDPCDFPDDVPDLERPPGGGARLCRLAPFIDIETCVSRGDRSRRRARIARAVCADSSAPLLACVAMMRGGRKAESFRLLARAPRTDPACAVASAGGGRRPRPPRGGGRRSRNSERPGG